MRTVTEYAIFKKQENGWRQFSTITESRDLVEMQYKVWEKHQELTIRSRTATYTDWEDMVV